MRGNTIMGAAALAFLLGATGCGEERVDFGRDCTRRELSDFGCDLCPASCGRPDAGVEPIDAGPGQPDAGVEKPPCDGECVAGAPLGWRGPVLLWAGTGSDVPECPSEAPVSSQWLTGPVAPPAICGACECKPPAGACTLPAAMSTSSLVCPGTASGANHITFDPPGGWTGACNAEAPIPAGEICSGALCVASLSIGPMAVTEGPCTPVGGGLVAPLDPPSWDKTILACQGSAWGVCENKGQTCEPVRPEGFTRCVFSTELEDCETAPSYSLRYTAYWSISDTRGCSPCACGPAMESACSAKVSVFNDPGCSSLLGTYSVDATGPKCFDLPPGAGLGSKLATPPIYTPGACQPLGGDPIGGIEPIARMTFCCLP